MWFLHVCSPLWYMLRTLLIKIQFESKWEISPVKQADTLLKINLRERRTSGLQIHSKVSEINGRLCKEWSKFFIFVELGVSTIWRYRWVTLLTTSLSENSQITPTSVKEIRLVLDNTSIYRAIGKRHEDVRKKFTEMIIKKNRHLLFFFSHTETLEKFLWMRLRFTLNWFFVSNMEMITHAFLRLLESCFASLGVTYAT